MTRASGSIETNDLVWLAHLSSESLYCPLFNLHKDLIDTSMIFSPNRVI